MRDESQQKEKGGIHGLPVLEKFAILEALEKVTLNSNERKRAFSTDKLLLKRFGEKS